MKRFKYKTKNKNTMNIAMFVVFFCVCVNAIIIFNMYGKRVNNKVVLLIDQKIDKIMYQFFSDLITNEVINKKSVNDLLVITKNNKDEILSVNYDMEKTYALLTKISNVIKTSISDLENGRIDVNIYDKYIKSGKNSLILNVPLFLNSKNIFLNNLGPMIPVSINFNETLLTNVKTKVTNYGFNNALLEVYITVEMQKLIITPVEKQENKFNYDVLVAALVINGSVPEFYGGVFETSSGILDIPIN